ncbi:MAG: glycosyltransferase [Desulfovibrionaceae bacterium]|nr:glycosyltransferase [Desulfovibrionaceae bacterium]
MRDLLRVTSAHVYLSYPFFLSYSPVEAMSCAAPLLLSDTPPCREVAEEDRHTLFADFFSPEDIADKVIRLLREPELARKLGAAAREHALAHYDFEKVCLPRWQALIEALASGRPAPELR